MALVVWRTGAWKLDIVKRSHAAGFEVSPKRSIVERTFAWISRNRRLARDFERYATTVAAFIRLAMIRIIAKATCCKRLVMNPIFSDGLLCLQTIRHLAAALGKLCHDLLVQPEVHFRRAVEGASITELLRQLLSSTKAAVQFQQ